jgi:pimeloyl-ACP methyl ester carboxylesterase
MGIVLVHGRWHDPGHFDPVRRRLVAGGFEVHVPELHRGSLAADTAAVQSAVDGMRAPPVVLGHSYGGSVITGLTGVQHLVYLAAFVPAAGESTASIGGTTDLVRAATIDHPDGTTSVRPELAVPAFYDDCPPAVAARAVSLLRPQRPGSGRGVPARQAWQDTDSTYVVCTRDRAFDPTVQEAMAIRCARAVRWRVSHSPFLSRPDLVAGMLSAV